MTDERARQPAPAPSLRSIAPSIFLPAMIYEVGNGAMAPVIALTALDLGASVVQAAFALALLGIGRVLGDIPASWLADCIGDRKAMLAASALQMLAVGRLGRDLPSSSWCCAGADRYVQRVVLFGAAVLSNGVGTTSAACTSDVHACWISSDRPLRGAVRWSWSDQLDRASRCIRRGGRFGAICGTAPYHYPGCPPRRTGAEDGPGRHHIVADVCHASPSVRDVRACGPWSGRPTRCPGDRPPTLGI